MDKYDIKGASELSDMADNVFIVWRNKRKEEAMQKEGVAVDKEIEDQPDATLNCCKQRHGEWEGSLRLWFNPSTLQYLENQSQRQIDVLKLG